MSRALLLSSQFRTEVDNVHCGAGRFAMRVRMLIEVFVQTIMGWSAQKAPLYAAALAYSTLFSLAPLLILTLFLASLTAHPDTPAMIEARLLHTIETQAGIDAANLTREILAARGKVVPSGTAALISFGFLLYGASTVFVQLRGALNAMWGIDRRVETVRQGLLGTGKSYLVSAFIALVIGLAPILLLFASAMAASMPNRQPLLSFFGVEWLEPWIAFFSSPVVYFVLLLLLFKWMPLATTPWRALWPGALLTALLYWFGGGVLSYYIRNAAIRSLYGAAGSSIALLLWAYYSAWMLLFGAKFIRVYADRRHYAIVPHGDAGFVETVFQVRE